METIGKPIYDQKSPGSNDDNLEKSDKKNIVAIEEREDSWVSSG
jgi:hypothetical protein